MDMKGDFAGFEQISHQTLKSQSHIRHNASCWLQLALSWLLQSLSPGLRVERVMDYGHRGIYVVKQKTATDWVRVEFAQRNQDLFKRNRFE